MARTRDRSSRMRGFQALSHEVRLEAVAEFDPLHQCRRHRPVSHCGTRLSRSIYREAHAGRADHQPHDQPASAADRGATASLRRCLQRERDSFIRFLNWEYRDAVKTGS